MLIKFKHSMKIGEVGKLIPNLDTQFQCVKSISPNKCNGCAFEPFPYNCICHEIECSSQEREDNENVIFIEL